jgi:ABC-type phosphate transport system substrate-binding protein
MLKLTRKVGIAITVAAAAASVLAIAAPAANADTAARGGDVVGVGSDTFQNGVDFVLDGAPGVAGGYNNVGNNHRAFNVFATGDANGRAVYDGNCGTPDTSGLAQFCGATTNQAPVLLPGTAILRAGTKPVTRPNGSGAGVAALISDSGTGYQSLPTGDIQFARMSRLPNSTETGNCPTTTTSCAGLHVYQEATDGLTIAHQASSYNGPAGLSADELYHIFVLCDYTKWNQIPGNTTGSGNTIHPLIPQSGSGTRNFFLADLAASQGITTTLNPGSCTRSVEEHDPTGIYADSAPADAIEPFSTGKLNLIAGTVPTAITNGYFSNPGYAGTGTPAEPQGAYTPGYLSTLTANAPDGTASFTDTRGLYITIRQADVTSTTGFQAGTSGTAANFTSVLFTTALTSAMRSAGGQAQLREAGFTPAFKDCGINPTTC